MGRSLLEYLFSFRWTCSFFSRPCVVHIINAQWRYGMEHLLRPLSDYRDSCWEVDSCCCDVCKVTKKSSNMDSIKFRCRKCRHTLFQMNNLITAKAKSLESGELNYQNRIKFDMSTLLICQNSKWNGNVLIPKWSLYSNLVTLQTPIIYVNQK